VYNPKHFDQQDAGTITELIRSFPLAALVTQTDGQLVANHIPFLLDGEIAIGSSLIGHVARANPVWQDTDPEAESLLIFQGPSAYITPNWYPSKQEHHQVVPTYNYAMVHVYGRLEVSHDEKVKRRVVAQLTNSMENMRGSTWRMGDAPADFIEKMLDAIVAVQYVVTRIEAKWKISQNRPDADRAGVVQGLKRQPLTEDDQRMARMVKAGTGVSTPNE
jgi:transcriptional regulator